MQLGIILTPYGKIPGAYPSEIAYSYGGDGTFMCPDDPYYNQRGEVGFYHDTQLGALPEYALTTGQATLPVKKGLKGIFSRSRARRIQKALHGLGMSVPTEYEISSYYGYMPQIDGWTVAKEGFQQGSWIPPNGWNPAGAYGPPMAPAGYTYPGPLGDAASDAANAAASAAAQQIDATLQAHQDRMFKLTIISTAIVGISALIATVRTWKQLKRDERLFESRLKRLAQ
jgi:hypothetical protein